MEPLTLASAFTAIVGLISTFKREHKDHQNLDYQLFRNWLETHRHQELLELIVKSQELPTEIDRLLKQDTEIILSKLDVINDILATLLSNVDGLKGITHAVHPSPELSDQALSILRQFVNSGSEEFGVIRHGLSYILNLTKGGMISFHEPKYIQDDLDKLVSLGFLRTRFGNNGNIFYGITRNAFQYIKVIDGK